MNYGMVAEAYRDLEAATGRLALIDRLAELLRATPDELLPTVCYLCQGLIAPEFAGIDLGLAEKLAVRAVADRDRRRAGRGRRRGPRGRATSARPPSSCCRRGRDRPASLTCRAWSTRCTRSPRPRGRAPRAASSTCSPGCWRRATPLEARYLLRLVTGNLRLGIGTPTILDALAVVHAGGRAGPAGAGAGLQHLLRPRPGRRARWPAAGWRRWRRLRVRPGNPVRVMLAQRLSEAARSWPSWAASARPSTSTTAIRVQAHRTADGRDRAVHPPAGADQRPVPRPGRGARRRARAAARRSSRARRWRTTRRPASCARSRRSCSGGASTASPRPPGTCRSACSASTCCTPTART